ncbi:MAG: Rieske 2Fe-2S domain-containing protein [Anaerolineales bacterium]|nr:Rieske 2Fe-2S domain-containing protein [Anaerolineales bacterium]
MADSDGNAEGQAEEQEQSAPPLNRREFLYYVWGVSMAVFMAGSGGAIVWFSLPRFREGEFGGVFNVNVDSLPDRDAPPTGFADGRFWLVNIGEESIENPRRPEEYPIQQGVLALYMVCVHLGCLYKWVDTNFRFECPCHGSKYLLSGERIDGPANRNLDVFIVEVVDAEGNVLSRTEPAWDGREGTAVQVPAEAAMLRVDTGMRINGAPNNQPGGGT